MRSSLLLCATSATLAFPAPPPSYNGLALKPPMGWRSWNL
jgi:hypothetical protein